MTILRVVAATDVAAGAAQAQVHPRVADREVLLTPRAKRAIGDHRSEVTALRTHTTSSLLEKAEHKQEKPNAEGDANPEVTKTGATRSSAGKVSGIGRVDFDCLVALRAWLAHEVEEVRGGRQLWDDLRMTASMR